MSKLDDGGPAFPSPTVVMPLTGGHIPDGGEGEFGMSLRDWFAGQALIGMTFSSDDFETWPELAMKAYTAADAMLAERAKAQP